MTVYKQKKKPNTKQKEQSGNCLRFTFLAFGGKNGFGFSESRQAWNGQKKRHVGERPPRGVYVPVWFDWTGTIEGVTKNWGHTAIALPDGRILSSPLNGYGQDIFASVSALEKAFGAKYLGWSEQMDGTVVVKPAPGKYRKKLMMWQSNLRKEPTTKSKVLVVLKPGLVRTVSTWTRGEKVQGSDVWIRVRYGIRVGWVHSSNFKIFTPATTKRLRELKRR